MANHATGVARAVLLTGAVWLAGVGSVWAQAAAEAGAIGAASTGAAGGTGRATGKSLGSVFAGVGAKVESSTTTTTLPSGAGRVNRASAPAGGDAAGPGIIVVAPAPKIRFDVVSFKRCADEGSKKVDMPADGDYVAAHCQPIAQLIYFAYVGATASNFNLSGYPLWVDTNLYDFEAKVAPEDIALWQKMGSSARRMAVQRLLADELKLKIRVDPTPKLVYTLSVADSGAKLKEYAQGEQQKLPNGLTLTGKDMTWVGRIAYFQDASMGNLAESLGAHLDRQVVNRTGLTGSYDFSLPLPQGTGNSAPSVAQAVSQLGLKLEAGKTKVDGVVVVDHIEPPSAN
ncbi:MAG TPA: TIGR03435 family protein [Acidobacteriaceae bacterium]